VDHSKAVRENLIAKAVELGYRADRAVRKARGINRLLTDAESQEVETRIYERREADRKAHLRSCAICKRTFWIGRHNGRAKFCGIACRKAGVAARHLRYRSRHP